MLGIYTRISKDRDNQISTKIQKQKGIELSKQKSIPYKLYEEEKGTSGGKSIDDRPKLKQLVDDIYDDKITAVYFYNQDRSARDEVTWFTLANLLIEKNVTLYENGLLVDLNNEDTYMLSGFKAIMNASERRKTGKRIKDALFLKAKDGIGTNPVLPYGYKKDEKKYIIVDEDEAAIVKRIFKMSNDGIGSEKTALIFNEEGIKTRYAKTAKGTLTTKNKITGKETTKDKSTVKWSGNTILQIIKNSWYYGERPYKGEIFEVPAILDKDYCLSTIDNLQKNRLNVGKITHQYLLKGVLVCECGCNMYGKNNQVKNEDYYMCSSKRTHKVSCGSPSINRPRIDELIWFIFFDDDKLKKLVAEHFENTNDKEMIESLNKELKILNHKAESNEEELKTTIKYGTKKIYSEAEVIAELKRIRTEKNDINKQILNVQNQIETYESIIKSSDNIIDEIDSYNKKAPFNDKKYIIKKYIKNIVVDYQYNHYVINVDFNLPNIKSQKYIVQRRFYYYKEMISGNFYIFNKFDKIKNGKVVNRTDLEFMNDVFKEKQQQEVAKIFVDDTIGFLNQLPKTDNNKWLLKKIKQLEELKNT